MEFRRTTSEHLCKRKEASFAKANIADRLNIDLGVMTDLELNNLNTFTLYIILSPSSTHYARYRSKTVHLAEWFWSRKYTANADTNRIHRSGFMTCIWCLVQRQGLEIMRLQQHLYVVEVLTFLRYNDGGTRSRSFLRYCATSRKVVGSIPDVVIGIFHWHKASGVDSASNRND